MKILYSRNVVTTPEIGQWLYFFDDTQEFDPMCAQTTAILTAEQYNGKAAKDDAGNWVPAPGPRMHDYATTLLGFAVGLTMVGMDSDNKAIYDYSVLTPTGVSFHGNGKDNTLHVPGNWLHKRVAAEIVAWMCLNEEDGAELPELTAEQRAWVDSPERDQASAAISEWMEEYDKPVPTRTIKALDFPVHFSSGATDALKDIGTKEKADELKTRIEEHARMYVDNHVYHCQSSIVFHVLSTETDFLSWEDVVNYYPDVDSMDGEDAAQYITDELNEDWRNLIQDEYDDEPEPDDLTIDDVAILQEYIRDNSQPAEVLEWWLVDEWLADQLESIGQATLTDGQCHWWGRRTHGQSIIQDGTMQKIAAKYADYL